MSQETKAFQYDLQVKGVWGRNRSVKFTSVRLAVVPEALPDDAVVGRARTLAATLKLKRASLAVVEYPATISDYGNGLQSVCLAITQGRKIAGWEVG
jgi:hypothetical protein